MTCACCQGACCSSDGLSCTQEVEDDCVAAGGTWQGPGTACGDYDCTQGCCEPATTELGCDVEPCRRGYNASECLSPCDPSGTNHAESGVGACVGGTPTSVTVTGSGYVGNSGDAALDAAIEGAFNAAYNISLDCDGFGAYTFASGIYTVTIQVNLPQQSASMVFAYFSTLSSMAITNVVAPLTTECGYYIYNCPGFSSAPNSISGYGDFSGATITVS